MLDAAAVTAAQTTVTLDNAALATAISSATTTIQTLEAAYQGTAATASSGFNVTHAAEVASFQSSAQTANATFASTVSSAISSATSSIDAAAVSAQTTEDGLGTSFQSTVAGIDAGFQGAKAIAEAAIASAVSAADAIYDGAITTARGTYDSTVAGADSTFNLAVTAADVAYHVTVDPATTAYDASGPANWTTYQNAIGTGVGGYEATLNSDVTTAGATRDSTVSAYPNLTFDLPAIMMSPNVAGSLDTAANNLDSQIQTINDNFDTAANSLVNGFFNGLNAPGGAIYNYNYQLKTAEDDYENSLDTAGTNFNSAEFTARQSYQSQLNGPSGLVATFQSTMQTALTTYNGLTQAAGQGYTGTVASAQTAHDFAVANIRNGLEAWNTSNPYRSAILARNSAFDSEIDGYLATFQSDLTTASQTRDLNNSTAESAFTSALQGPYSTFQTSLISASTVFQTAQQTAMTAYQTAVTNFMTSMMSSMMPSMTPGMMSGGGPPSMTPLYQATKQYFVDVTAAGIIYTTTTGNAAMAFLSAAFAQQSTRDGQYITNGQTEAISNVNDGASALEDAVNGQSTYYNDLATQVAAFQIAAQAQLNASLAAVSAADVVLHTTESTAGKLAGEARSAAQENYEKDFETAFETLRIGAAGLSQTLKNAVAAAAETYQNDVAAATSQLVSDENAVKSTLFASLIPGLTGMFTSYANLVQNRTTSISEKVEDWVKDVSLIARNEFVAENGGTSDAVTVGNAWQTYLDTVASKWKTFTDNSAGALTTFVTTDSTNWGSLMSTILGAKATSATSIVNGHVALVATKAAAGTALLGAEAAAGNAWTSSVAPAEKSAYQGLATAAKGANDSYFAALKSTLDSAIQNADAFFVGGLPFLTTAASQISAAGQTAATSIISAGTSALTTLISARQTRDITLINADTTLLQGLTPLGTSIATAVAQREVDRAILTATEANNNVQNTPVNNFAGMAPGMTGIHAMLMMSMIGTLPGATGSTDYKGRFLDTITDPDLKATLEKSTSGKNSPWQIHHTYQKAPEVQAFLREMKGQKFDVHSPDLTVAIPANVHSRITAEQGKFWRDQWDAIPDARKRKLLPIGPDGNIPGCSIGNVIAATQLKDRAALLAKMEAMIQGQKEYFSPYWLNKGSTAADLNKLAGKLGIGTANGKLPGIIEKVTSESAIEKFREIYQPRGNTIWETLKGKGGVAEKLKTTAKVATRLGMIMMAIAVIENDLAMAGDSNAPLWKRAYQDFEMAAKSQEERGYPKPKYVEDAAASLKAALNGFQSGGDAAGILKYLLDVKLELEISEMR